MWSYPTKMWCIPQSRNSTAVPRTVGLSRAAVRSSWNGPYFVKTFCAPPHETMSAAWWFRMTVKKSEDES